MKKSFLILLAIVLCGVLSACGVSKEESALIESKWIHVYDGDEYTFTESGVGKHGGISINYEVEDTAVYIIEGAGSASETVFTLDLENEIPKLIPSDRSGYFVREEDYATVSEQVARETRYTLTSTQIWFATVSGAYSYIAFNADNSVAYQVNNWTMGGTWELVDNNTVRMNIDSATGSKQNTLDLVYENGTPKLISTNASNVVYTPYQK